MQDTYCYHTQESIDNDDASEYFDTHHNFFTYGGGGLKSDFDVGYYPVCV